MRLVDYRPRDYVPNTPYEFFFDYWFLLPKLPQYESFHLTFYCQFDSLPVQIVSFNLTSNSIICSSGPVWPLSTLKIYTESQMLLNLTLSTWNILESKLVLQAPRFRKLIGSIINILPKDHDLVELTECSYCIFTTSEGTYWEKAY